ncbi:hypothetical protein LEP1GSC073_1399 [Leptospira noguchii str. Cascata]|nr:hypothetical protein LEP1GSC073_1399 [Leptospira noguchii str. Cascata]
MKTVGTLTNSEFNRSTLKIVGTLTNSEFNRSTLNCGNSHKLRFNSQTLKLWELLQTQDLTDRL